MARKSQTNTNAPFCPGVLSSNKFVRFIRGDEVITDIKTGTKAYVDRFDRYDSDDNAQTVFLGDRMVPPQFRDRYNGSGLGPNLDPLLCILLRQVERGDAVVVKKIRQRLAEVFEDIVIHPGETVAGGVEHDRLDAAEHYEGGGVYISM